ncbi:Phytochrome, two-component sensor histidine kinase [Rhodovulum sp. P5]|uniref:HWE histidine kinase domain-containing protein n=1 Tax=Rhodovulum sp. P5 TaxID=1564506 RepID=UPI0009C24843|nr:HWE histidine kinase domain-containing protein [Rhodovulum sp. P5]ARE41975.1 Phytochrome, two-component sensor histidine kinase [Rhodovulum sp. P5]
MTRDTTIFKGIGGDYHPGEHHAAILRDITQELIVTDGLTDAELDAALAECAAEPVHIPGRIQPHGALIAVDPRTLKICYASESCAEVIGIAAEALLGTDLSAHVDGKVKHDLINALHDGPPAGDPTEVGILQVGTCEVWATTCPGGPYAIIQFEPLDDAGGAKMDTALRDLSHLTAQIQTLTDTKDLLDRSVQMLRMLTGYDRVLVYKFDPDGNGTVLAEEASAELEPYLGLSFPKWDVPAQARAIMEKIPMRYIADAGATASALLKSDPALPELDMTAASLRGVSEIHLEYLRNMGHLGTMTLHVMVEGQVWGVISLMHCLPRRPGHRVRQVCNHFMRMFSVKLNQLLVTERLARLQRADALKKSIAQAASEPGFGDVFEVQLLRELCDAMRADGAAVVHHDNLVTTGETPTQANLKTLFHSDLPEEGVLVSSALSADEPKLSEICGSAFSGLLLVPLPENTTFAFFRKGRERKVSWAGAPEKSIEWVEGRARLRPRGSFETYRALVEGTAEPWGDSELRLADDLWAMLVTAERRVLIERTNRQQQILINELNHRVRNILALIRSLSQQTLTHNGSIQSYVRALEARIAAVASAHNLGAEQNESGATAGQIIAVEAAPFNEGDDRIIVKGDDVGIRNDMAPLFALVVHELMTNAAKYGALSVATGIVTVRLKLDSEGLSLKWVETGGPPIKPGRRKGFGTTLIETSVPYELGGHVGLEFHESGLVADIHLPQSTLLSRTALGRGKTVEPHSAPPLSVKGLPVTNGVCLLVEDNFIVSLDTTRVLKDIGFERVETVPSTADALAKLTRITPSFAVLDINLGEGATSAEIADILKDRNIPFVFVSGYGSASPIGERFKTVPTLKKPLRSDQISEAILEMTS